MGATCPRHFRTNPASASLIRVCHPGPVARKYATTSGSRRTATRIFDAALTGRPRVCGRVASTSGGKVSGSLGDVIAVPPPGFEFDGPGRELGLGRSRPPPRYTGCRIPSVSRIRSASASDLSRWRRYQAPVCRCHMMSKRSRLIQSRRANGASNSSPRFSGSRGLPGPVARLRWRWAWWQCRAANPRSQRLCGQHSGGCGIQCLCGRDRRARNDLEEQAAKPRYGAQSKLSDCCQPEALATGVGARQTARPQFSAARQSATAAGLRSTGSRNLRPPGFDQIAVGATEASAASFVLYLFLMPWASYDRDSTAPRHPQVSGHGPQQEPALSRIHRL